MQQIEISKLKPHPRNTEFFDDMEGEKWEEFLESIRSRGVIEPIVITPDKTIVSGHQRVRACQELGITTVMCDVHTYDNDDQILQDLIETNVKQRGEVGGSAKKIGMRIKELERIYGIRNGSFNEKGNNRIGDQNNFGDQMSQQDLAAKLNMTDQTLRNYKLLTEMIPELEELVDTGMVTKTTALALMKNLSSEDQKALLDSIPTDKKYTQRQMDMEIQKYKEKISQLVKEKEIMEAPKVETVVVKEDTPETLKELQTLKKRLNEASSEIKDINKESNFKTQQISDLKKQIENMKQSSPEEVFKKKLTDHTIFFCDDVARFIEKVGGYVWLADYFNEIPEYQRDKYEKAVNAVYAWADTLLANLHRD